MYDGAKKKIENRIGSIAKSQPKQYTRGNSRLRIISGNQRWNFFHFVLPARAGFNGFVNRNLNGRTIYIRLGKLPIRVICSRKARVLYALQVTAVTVVALWQLHRYYLFRPCPMLYRLVTDVCVYYTARVITLYLQLI